MVDGESRLLDQEKVGAGRREHDVYRMTRGRKVKRSIIAFQI